MGDVHAHELGPDAVLAGIAGWQLGKRPQISADGGNELFMDFPLRSLDSTLMRGSTKSEEVRNCPIGRAGASQYFQGEIFPSNRYLLFLRKVAQ